MAHSAVFTPAASSHTAGDCVGAATAIGTLGVEGSYAIITSVSLMIASSTAVSSAWRLHLYTGTPASAIADDAAWDITTADRTQYLGYIAIDTIVDVGTTQYIQMNDVHKHLKLDGQIYGYLVNLSTVTLAAVAHTVSVEAVYL